MACRSVGSKRRRHRVRAASVERLAWRGHRGRSSEAHAIGAQEAGSADRVQEAGGKEGCRQEDHAEEANSGQETGAVQGREKRAEAPTCSQEANGREETGAVQGREKPVEAPSRSKEAQLRRERSPIQGHKAAIEAQGIEEVHAPLARRQPASILRGQAIGRPSVTRGVGLSMRLGADRYFG